MRDDGQPERGASGGRPAGTPGPPRAGAPGDAPIGRLVARLVGRRRRAALNAGLAAGRARRVAAEELLAADRLPEMASLSLALLLAGGAGFGALEIAARGARGATAPAGLLGVAGIVAGNVLGYLVVLPLHEGVHAAVILALGGRPRFGLRLPFALYCTAPGQLFTRAGYAAVALAPLVAISLAGAAAIWLSPTAGLYLLLALAGNVSGAVGDLVAARGLLRLPPGALIADTATGYIGYVVDA
jgi:hypothetical protein